MMSVRKGLKCLLGGASAACGVLALLVLPVCLTADDTDAPEQVPERVPVLRL